MAACIDAENPGRSFLNEKAVLCGLPTSFRLGLESRAACRVR
jgi:hypothetical protein